MKAGYSVCFYGRPRLKRIINEVGLRLVCLDGRLVELDSLEFNYNTDARSAIEYCPNLVILSSKVNSTIEIIDEIYGAVEKNLGDYSEQEVKALQTAVLVSVQNGTNSRRMIRTCLSSLPMFSDIEVFAGMFPFNVVASFREVCFTLTQGTEGEIVFEASPATAVLTAALLRSGLPCRMCSSDAMEGVLYGKLLLNLNNSINALAGVPLLVQLQDWHYRKVFSFLIEEAISVFNAAGIQATSLTHAPLWAFRRALTLPNCLFFRVAKASLAIKEEATVCWAVKYLHSL